MRKGLGIGQGQGYSNIVGMDKKVHSDSAKGIRQPQKIGCMSSSSEKITQRSMFPSDSPKYTEAVELAIKNNVMFEDKSRYDYFIERNNGADYTLKGLSKLNKKQKEIIVGNRPKLGVMSPDFELEKGSLTAIGYDRKLKKKFIELSKVEYPQRINMTGEVNTRIYENDSIDTPLYRIHKSLK